MSPRRLQDRGAYCPIARALRAGHDFQQLSSVARHVFLDLKIAFGPSGIEVRYPDALVAEMTHTTGYSTTGITAALDELERGAWVKRQENVIWVVDQLRFNPHMLADNANHCIAVQNHVNGLPRLKIVREFISYYTAYFADVEKQLAAYPAEGTGAASRPIESDHGDSHAPYHAPCPSDGMGDQQLAVTNSSTITNTTSAPGAEGGEKRIDGGDGRGGDDAHLIGFARCWDAYPRRKGSDSKNRAERAYLARVRAGVDEQHLYDRTRAYRAFCDATGKSGTEFVMMGSTFFGPDRRYDDNFDLPEGDSSMSLIPGARDAADSARLRKVLG